MTAPRSKIGAFVEAAVPSPAVALERSVVLFAAVCYVLTAAETVQGGDSGELAAVGAHGGVAHPPGYPLYVLWLRATSWLPAASPAHRAALATAALGALAVLALQRACRAWGAGTAATIAASLTFLTSPLAWRLSTEPEVFTLNVALAMFVLAAASPRSTSERSPARRLIVLALLAGLGIANHHTIVLLAPIGVLAVGRALAASRRRLRDAGLGLAAFAGGLSPYAYVVWVTRTTPLGDPCVWGDAGDLGGLLRHFFRVDYGTTRLAVSTEPPDVVGQLAHLGRTMLVSGVGIMLLGAFVAWLVLPPRRRWSWDVAALVASLGLAGPVFVSRFNLPPRGLSGIVVDRFHLLPLALATVIGALGLERIVQRVRGRRARPAMIALALTGAAAVVVRATATGAAVRAHHHDTVQRYLENVLAFLPPRAILLVSSDDQVGGFEYMKCAVAARPDVDVLSPHLLLTQWYARRTSARLGIEIERGEVHPGSSEPVLDGARLLVQLLDTDRPLFAARWFADNLESSFPSYPVGPLIRIVRSPGQVPPPPQLYEWNATLYAGMTLDDHPPPRATWAGMRFTDYARPWNVLATAFERHGETERARECRERAARFLPR